MDAVAPPGPEHAVQRHLSVPQRAEHETAPAEHDPRGVDHDPVFLPLAHNRQIRLAILRVPVRIFLADEVNDRITARCTAPGFLDTSLGYAAWRSSYSSRASSGVRYASFSRRQHRL